MIAALVEVNFNLSYQVGGVLYSLFELGCVDHVETVSQTHFFHFSFINHVSHSILQP